MGQQQTDQKNDQIANQNTTADKVVERETLLEFPCEFPIKIMGKQAPTFIPTILELVVNHAPDFDTTTAEIRPSSTGKYVGITCTIQAISQAQLDALYMDLSHHELVSVVL